MNSCVTDCSIRDSSRWIALSRVRSCVATQRLVIGAIPLRLYLVGGIEGEAEIVLRRLALLDPLVKCLFDGFALVERLSSVRSSGTMSAPVTRRPFLV